MLAVAGTARNRARRNLNATWAVVHPRALSRLCPAIVGAVTSLLTAPPPRSGASALPVEVRGLRKAYGDVVAVDGVDLTVNEGDIYGYLGANGAGKTTTLRMVLGLI